MFNLPTRGYLENGTQSLDKLNPLLLTSNVRRLAKVERNGIVVCRRFVQRRIEKND